jgi:hypothetical protein
MYIMYTARADNSVSSASGPWILLICSAAAILVMLLLAITSIFLQKLLGRSQNLPSKGIADHFYLGSMV